MRVHLTELELARTYTQSRVFEHLSSEQVRLIMNRGRELHRWFKSHPGIHALISACVICWIFAMDFFVLIRLPRFMISSSHPSLAAVIFAAVVTGAAHSWLMYSLTIYSLHEGAAHNMIFPGAGPFSRAGSLFATNMSRVASGDPAYYAVCHMAHHAGFGTEKDSEFLNFVIPARFWRMLLPLGTFLNYSDFVIHRPLVYTRSRVISAVTSAVYNGVYAYIVYRLFGPLFTIVMLLVLPHVGFYMDRLRQFTEHNLMPLDNKSGARSFGVGFWGLLVGGGPWGQPCHLAHHLVASIPWYQQIVLHRHFVGLLTEKQREQFLLKPLTGYPSLLWGVVREANLHSRGSSPRVAGVGGLKG